jgi:cell shape-determining protein MreC
VKVDPRALEYQKLQRENERLADQLRKAEIVIDVQKKVAMLLGRPFPEVTPR